MQSTTTITLEYVFYQLFPSELWKKQFCHKIMSVLDIKTVKISSWNIQMSRIVTKPNKMVCAPSEDWSTWASAQSDQSSRALNGSLRTQAFYMRTAKTLIRLGGCQADIIRWACTPFCWFCHDAAQILNWNIIQIQALSLSQKSRGLDKILQS